MDDAHRGEVTKTGGQLVLREIGAYTPILGSTDYYDAKRRVILLCSLTANGSDWRSILSAAHEVGHVRQHRQWPWLVGKAWFLPVKLFLEWDACRRAEKLCAGMITPSEITAARVMERRSLLKLFFGLH